MKDRLLRVPVLGTAMRMQERYTEDAADALAASIGFFGFLSLFPLLALVLSAVGAFFGNGAIIGDNFIDAAELTELVIDAVPALGSIAGGENGVGEAIDYITQNPGQLLGIGSIGLVVAGLRIASGAQQACSVVFRREIPSGLGARVEQLVALTVVGTVALLGAAVTSVVGANLGGDGFAGLAATVVGLGVGFVLDVGLFLLAYRLFTPDEGPEWSVLLPGSLLGGAGWTILKLAGSGYVASQASSAGSNYGALGSIIALLLLLYLAGRVFLYGAELAALLSGLDDRHVELDMVETAQRVPWVDPAPRPDTPPEPSDAARLAVSGVVVAVAATVIDRVLGD